MDSMIDQAMVEQFVAGAHGATTEQINVVVERLENMVRRGERVKQGDGWVSTATMAEAARRLRAMLPQPAEQAAPVAAEVSTPEGYIRVRLTVRNTTKDAFAKAVQRIKLMGGRYDADSKTWLIKESVAAANASILAGDTERVS